MARNLWDEAKAVQQGSLQPQINNVTLQSQILHLKELKEEPTKLQVSKRKEITKIRAEINEIKTKRKKETIEKINETKNWFFEFQ